MVSQPETQYQNLSDEQLFGLFAADTYSALNESQLLDAYQEVVNRECIRDGGEYAVHVEFADLKGDLWSSTDGETVYLNHDLLVNGTMICEVELPGGETQTRSIAVENVNLQGLASGLHEYRHCFELEAMQGNAKAEKEQILAFSANVQPNAQGQSQYIRGVSSDHGALLYAMNPVELDANQFMESRMQELLENHPLLSRDAGREQYETWVRENGVEAILQQCRDRYGPTAVEDLEAYMVAQFQGKEPPALSPELEAALAQEQDALQLLEAEALQTALSGMTEQDWAEFEHNLEAALADPAPNTDPELAALDAELAALEEEEQELELSALDEELEAADAELATLDAELDDMDPELADWDMDQGAEADQGQENGDSLQEDLQEDQEPAQEEDGTSQGQDDDPEQEP